jgi:hypothetical protein
MTAETEALGKCTECGKVYAVYQEGERWRVLGTGGGCSCGSDELTVLSPPE